MDIIFSNLSSDQADLVTLILASQGIRTQTRVVGQTHSILVEPRDWDPAALAVKLYYEENRESDTRTPPARIPVSSFWSPCTVMIMIVISVIHTASFYYQVHDRLILDYGSSTLFIRQGEYFRVVTALFLHADTRHLIGNLGGLILFAAPAISLSGYGTGAFLLLAAGATGNLINALFQNNAHLSIGASTAIMGAAGLLAGWQVIHQKKGNRFNAVMPVFACAVLVALFSQGERTDVWAHLFGFSCGLGYGISYYYFRPVLNIPNQNRILLAVSLAVTCFCFLSGR